MLLKKGAEAVVKSVYFDGRPAVLKERTRKNYRITELDEKLRSQRTRTEAKITGEAGRVGIRTAQIYFTDENNFSIYFQPVEGALLKDAFVNSDTGRIAKLSLKWGEAVAKLHSAGIIHGDLTTSNALVLGEEIYVLDFGLAFFSKREEDMAEDINLLRRAVEAVHNEDAKAIWGGFAKGYTENAKSGVIAKAAEVASRGRYSKRNKA
ncbi:MAG: Kae1-associated serine/threonine protein kinase [Candidatus Aenigmarchaeota archaeon]|nr:Kae1-associated serine/threonine protein kinase [Candidatus Aenigmarchaeota archaeon]